MQPQLLQSPADTPVLHGVSREPAGPCKHLHFIQSLLPRVAKLSTCKLKSNPEPSLWTKNKKLCLTTAAYCPLKLHRNHFCLNESTKKAMMPMLMFVETYCFPMVTCRVGSQPSSSDTKHQHRDAEGMELLTKHRHQEQHNLNSLARQTGFGKAKEPH